MSALASDGFTEVIVGRFQVVTVRNVGRFDFAAILQITVDEYAELRAFPFEFDADLG